MGTEVALLQTRAATPLPTEGKVNRLISEVDVAVIGAGAAGIAAARRLVEARTVSVLNLCLTSGLETVADFAISPSRRLVTTDAPGRGATARRT